MFARPNNPNLNVNKTFAIAQLNTDWIFYLDPDETIPEELAERIRASTAAGNTRHAAIRIPRRNHFFGRWLRFGGQYPDYQVRLFRPGKAVFPNRHVHESLKIEGTTGVIDSPFDHSPLPHPG